MSGESGSYGVAVVAHCRRGTNFKLSLIRYVAAVWEHDTIYLCRVDLFLVQSEAVARQIIYFQSLTCHTT